MQSISAGSAARLFIKTFFLSLCFTTLATFSVASNLPPKHEAARILLFVESLVEDEQWLEASKQLEILWALKVEQPVIAKYFSGVVAKARGNEGSATHYLEAYVVEAGESGQYYRQALQLLTDIEVNAQPAPETNTVLPKIASAESDSYLTSIKALFLTDNDKTALLRHINSLLAAHIYTGERIRLEGQKKGVKYSVSSSEGSLVVTKTSYESGKPFLTVEKVPVFGVDPFVDFACSDVEFACWISHPSTNVSRWLWIDRDELVAAELAKALSALLKVLQSGS